MRGSAESHQSMLDAIASTVSNVTYLARVHKRALCVMSTRLPMASIGCRLVDGSLPKIPVGMNKYL